MKRFAIVVTAIVFLLPTVVAQDVMENKWHGVPYTQEEKKLIEEMKAEYNIIIEMWSDEGYFKQKPDLDQVPPFPGKMNEDDLKAITAYINIVRMGVGLSPLEWSAEISEAAQYKAALIQYNRKIGANIGHYPEQPDEIDDAFYKKAQSFMGGENVYMAGLFTGDALYSVVYALTDIMGDPIECRHRYNLLNPLVSEFGLGMVDAQAVHKFNGANGQRVDAVAWPSGVCMPESERGGFWTIRFYDGAYRTTPETTVTVTWLNTGEQWQFEEGYNSSTHEYHVVDENQVSFWDKTLENLKPNHDVYEILVEGLEGKKSSYQYRLVYEDVYRWGEEDPPEPTTEPDLPVAIPSTQKVLINGEEVAFDAYNVDGYNYFKLRDLAYVLSGTEKSFDVTWDESKNAISLTTKMKYTVVGGEMAKRGGGVDKTPIPTTSKIYLDGEERQFMAYNIEGNNYFKLRDIMSSLDVSVGYDEQTKIITIDTSGGYTE